MKKNYYFLLVFIAIQTNLLMAAETPESLVEKVRAKLDKVQDYTADAILKTNVAFIKAPVGTVKVYYRKPNQVRIEKSKGLSILPKGGTLMNLSTLLTIKNYDAIDAGEVVINQVKTRKIRILPKDGEGEVVVMDLYIEEKNVMLMKTSVTTKENGSFDMEMTYGKFKEYMLPDKLVFNFNVKNYKMPKTISLDFDEQLSKEESAKLKNKKGTVVFTYSNYIINKGLRKELFEK